jgi:hypothetical protein
VPPKRPAPPRNTPTVKAPPIARDRRGRPPKGTRIPSPAPLFTKGQPPFVVTGKVGLRGLVRFIRNETQDGVELASKMLRIARGEIVEYQAETTTLLFDRQTGRPIMEPDPDNKGRLRQARRVRVVVERVTPTLPIQMDAIAWLVDRGYGRALTLVNDEEGREGKGSIARVMDRLSLQEQRLFRNLVRKAMGRETVDESQITPADLATPVPGVVVRGPAALNGGPR